jgi:hypothetical protein
VRARYRAVPLQWIDLAEQSASEVGDAVLVCDECGPERPAPAAYQGSPTASVRKRTNGAAARHVRA